VLRVPLHIGWPIVALIACGTLYYVANRALYYPVKFPQGAWDEQGPLGATDVWLDTQDGVRLHAWWVRANGSALATLFLHGNAGNITHRAANIREIVAAGSSVLMLDYRGYGKSAGRPTEKGLYTDSETAYIYLLGLGYRSRQIILHGESLGSAVAVDLAYRRPCAGLVLEAPFNAASDVAATVLPVLGPALVHGYNSIPKIRWLLMPKLFMQGDRDEVIPLRLGEALFAAAQTPKSFWIVEGAGHNDILETAGSGYRDHLRAFYTGVAAAPEPRNRLRPR
jgi:fermentation-respiration switch protein FrsA (DUF1100 family)